MVKVLSVGGSIVVPEFPDTEFLKKFSTLVRTWLAKDDERKLILVVGGGGPARIYQNAYKQIIENPADNGTADWIGIMATRLNAQLLKSIFSDLCLQDVVYDPTSVSEIIASVIRCSRLLHIVIDDAISVKIGNFSVFEMYAASRLETRRTAAVCNNSLIDILPPRIVRFKAPTILRTGETGAAPCIASMDEAWAV